MQLKLLTIAIVICMYVAATLGSRLTRPYRFLVSHQTMHSYCIFKFLYACMHACSYCQHYEIQLNYEPP